MLRPRYHVLQSLRADIRRVAFNPNGRSTEAWRPLAAKMSMLHMVVSRVLPQMQHRIGECVCVSFSVLIDARTCSARCNDKGQTQSDTAHQARTKPVPRKLTVKAAGVLCGFGMSTLTLQRKRQNAAMRRVADSTIS